MRVTYRGPAGVLTLANGRDVGRGETADIPQATIDALKKAGHRFGPAADKSDKADEADEPEDKE